MKRRKRMENGRDFVDFSEKHPCYTQVENVFIRSIERWLRVRKMYIAGDETLDVNTP